MIKTLVIGGTGFFGRHIVRAFAGDNVLGLGKSIADLTKPKDAYALINNMCPQIVIHAAALSGGIVWNRDNSSRIFHDNTMMTLNLLKACAESKTVKKVVSIISSCAYPDLGDTVLEEGMFWYGLPNESIMYFGLQKRNIFAYSMALARDTGKTFICPVVNNLYGPGDSYDLHKTKVVGAMIKKFLDAKQNGVKEVVCFGTGKPKRQFTYVEDAAQIIKSLTEVYDDSTSVINVTTPAETTIQELAEWVAHITEYEGKIIWDTEKPDGQMRKAMDCTKLTKLLGPFEWTGIVPGLKKTLEDYKCRMYL